MMEYSKTFSAPVQLFDSVEINVIYLITISLDGQLVTKGNTTIL